MSVTLDSMTVTKRLTASTGTDTTNVPVKKVSKEKVVLESGPTAGNATVSSLPAVVWVNIPPKKTHFRIVNLNRKL